MYRIAFDTSTARWIIQLRTFGVFWNTIKEGGKDRQWQDYDTAAAYVSSVGIDKVYRNYADSPAAGVWAGGQPTYAMVAEPAVIRRR